MTNTRMRTEQNEQITTGRRVTGTLRKVMLQTAGLSAAVLLLTAAPVYAAEDAAAGNTTATEVTAATTVIGAENAQNFAFADAGIDPLAADSLKTKYDYDDDEGQFVYDVEFIADGAEYEYEIQAYDGCVLEKSVEYYTLKNTLLASTDLTGSITLEEAKEIALTDAGLTGDDAETAGTNAGTGTTETESAGAGSTETEGSEINPSEADTAEAQSEIQSEEAVTITFTKERLDEEDGLSVYELEFYTDSMKYEYEISAVTGDILSVSMKVRTANTAEGGSVTSASSENGSTGSSQSSANSGNSTSGSASTGVGTTDSANSSGNSNSTDTSSSYISVDEAKEIALAYAGLSSSDVTFKKAKLDSEHGVMIYEIEFYQGNIEYECEINATTGTVIEFEKDYD